MMDRGAVAAPRAGLLESPNLWVFRHKLPGFMLLGVLHLGIKGTPTGSRAAAAPRTSPSIQKLLH